MENSLHIYMYNLEIKLGFWKENKICFCFRFLLSIKYQIISTMVHEGK